MGRSFLGLIGRKNELKADRIYASAQAVCAVILGAQVRRLSARRPRGDRACEIGGFDELPLFSKLVICLVGRAVGTKTGLQVDDRADTATATALAAGVAPSRHEAEQLLRLAREEAARIVGQRWAVVGRLAAALAQRGELAGATVTRIVLRHTPPSAKGRPPRAAPRANRPAGAARAPVSWMTAMLARCAALLGR
jgi:hypothetical protein